MSLDQSVMESELNIFNDSNTPANMPTDAATAATLWSQAYSDYLKTGSAGAAGAPIPAALDALVPVVAASISATFSIQTMITTFWAQISGAAASIWPTAISATPPTSAIDEPALRASLNSPGITSASANSTMSAEINTASQGAIIQFPPPPGGIGPQPFA